jgi:hypothetical protein
MRGVRHYLHFLVGQVRGRMGHERLGDNRLSDVVD